MISIYMVLISTYWISIYAIYLSTGVFDKKNAFFGPTVHRHHEDS